MAERAGAHIVTVRASHASMVSQPAAATRLILEAVAATGLHQGQGSNGNRLVEVVANR